MRHTLAIVSLLLAAACATYDAADSPMPGALSEADIAGIVAAAHEGEVRQGQAASSRASSAEARSFAQMMVTDHTNALNRANELFGRLNVTPAENDTSRALRSGTDRAITNLNTYSGAAFDRTYVQAQVAMHEWMLSTLDTALIPSARTPDVRTLLQAQRESVVKHLDHARTTLAGLPR